MKKGKNLVALMLCLAMCSVPMQAASDSRKKDVQYGGVNVYYNGTYQNEGSQAIVIDGVTYLPVKSLEGMLGYSVQWDSDTKTININGSTYTAATSAQAEIQAKNAEIEALRKELQTLKNEGVVASSSSGYTTTSGKEITNSELSDTRRELDSRFSDYFNNVDLDFALSLSSNRLRVTIEIDDSSDYREFTRLSRSNVKSFLEDVCYFIRQRHDDIQITGVVEYTRNRNDLYSFNYSKNDNFSYSEGDDYYYDDYYNYYETDLLRIINQNTSLGIDDYSNSISFRDGSTKVDISDNREEIYFYIYIDVTDDIKTAWNKNTGANNNSKLRNYMEEIAHRLYRETGYKIYGEIRNYANSTRIGDYDYQYDELYTQSI